MADSNLTQQDAEALMALDKIRVSDEEWSLPNGGGGLVVPLVSTDRREDFFLDVWQSRIDFAKGRYQERGRQVVVLARLDFGGQLHRNPDGEEVGTPHLHVYREGFGAKWAYSVSADHFPDTTDRRRLIHDFMRYCRIVQPPYFKQGLFS